MKELFECVVLRKRPCLPSLEDLLKLANALTCLGYDSRRLAKLLLLQPTFKRALMQECNVESVAPYTYSMKLVDYVECARKVRKRPLKGGKVTLNEEDMIELALGFLSRFKGECNEEVVKELRPLIKRREGTRPLKVPKGVRECFPPCIDALMRTLQEGQHLTHHERFFLATFLLNVGYNVNEVLELFKPLPDFNEKVARYQVEHLAGLRGSRKRYLPYSCKRARELGLCVSECNVKNPVTYYEKCVVRTQKREPSTS